MCFHRSRANRASIFRNPDVCYGSHFISRTSAFELTLDMPRSVKGLEGIHKVRPHIALGPFALARHIRCAKECQLLAAAYRSSQVIGAGTHVVLTRRCHCAAFGIATRARPCRHPFFMLCFLAGCSAGTDGSLIGRAGRGLGLSRRNERRAEERRSNKSGDCKFGSHKKVSPTITGCQHRLDALCANPMSGRWRLLENNGESRIVESRRSNETAIPALPGVSKFFLAIIVVALGTLIGLFAFTALTL